MLKFVQEEMIEKLDQEVEVCYVVGFVIQLYIRVYVVLTRQHCRKEREKSDINLDSAVLWECH